ncbi:MAG: hypothetical protein LWW86_07270 [Micrococcales bacterium]|nr:hypothetical protein [Micrococcales bacterium]
MTATRRRAAAAYLLVSGLLAAGCQGGDGTDRAGTSAPAKATPTTTTTTPTPPPELPGGGRTVFPDYRLFGYSGQPGAPGQGRLGIGDLDERVVEIKQRGKNFAHGRKIMPVLELISTVVHGSPGKDGMYRSRIPDEQIQEHLAAARRHDGMLLLNIQPGRADFLAEVKHYERYLLDPHVGLALDPEWAVKPGQVPGRVYGSTTGAELDSVSQYVATLVKRHDLPQKVIVVHQLHRGIITGQDVMKRRSQVAWVKSIDGIGGRGAKIDTWNAITPDQPALFHGGFKLFYEEDAQHGPLMTPGEVMALRPVPEYVLYE